MADDNDPAIDAAFGGHPIHVNPSPPVEDDDQAIKLAFSPPASTLSAAAQARKAQGKEGPKSFIGGLESIANTVTGGVGALGGGLTYLGTLAATGDTEAAKAVQEDTQNALTYQPRTSEGKKQAATVGNAVSYLGSRYGGPAAEATYNKTGSPLLASAAATAVNVPQFLLGIRGSKASGGLVPESTSEAPSFGLPNGSSIAESSLDHPQSIGAGKATVDLSNASPELQQAHAALGPSVNQEALARHVQADSLPVPMRLTKGQATGNPSILSDEMNNRGATGLDQFLNKQGQALKDNLTAIRDQVGPDVFTTNPVEHGDTLIDAYKAKDAPVMADINQKYQALRDANNGQFPVDAKALFQNASQALHNQMLFENAPGPVMRSLSQLADTGQMSFEQFEALRTNLARTMRSATDGNERAAAGVIRNAMEELPLQAGAANLKPLADAARNAALARYEALSADPAYDAAVNDKISPDAFVRKFVTGQTATRDGVATMRANLADNPTALQTMSVATLDDLRTAAGVNRDGSGIFGQKRFNDRLQSLEPKLPSLLPQGATEHLTNLGNVARYIKERPEGATVNESGTLSGALAHAAGKTVTSIANYKTGGIAGPVIEHVKGKMNAKALQAKLEEATAPLAGVEQK